MQPLTLLMALAALGSPAPKGGPSVGGSALLTCELKHAATPARMAALPPRIRQDLRLQLGSYALVDQPFSGTDVLHKGEPSRRLRTVRRFDRKVVITYDVGGVASRTRALILSEDPDRLGELISNSVVGVTGLCSRR